MGISFYPNSQYVDFYRDLVEGKMRGITTFNDFGYNDAFGTTRETLFPLGGLYYWLPSAQQLQVYSDSAEDTIDGVGAQKIQITGLDPNFESLQETIDLNGTTSVTTANSFIRVLRIQAIQAGSSETNSGEIHIDDNAGNNTIETIMPEEGVSHSATWTTANNRHSYIVAWHGSELSNKGIKMELWRRFIDDNVWQVSRLSYIFGMEFERAFTIPFDVPAKTDIELRVIGQQSGSKAAGGFSGY